MAGGKPQPNKSKEGIPSEGKPDAGLSGAMARLLGLNLLVEMGAQTYSFREVSGWLGKTGFRDHRQVEMKSVPGFSLILGTKPTE